MLEIQNYKKEEKDKRTLEERLQDIAGNSPFIKMLGIEILEVKEGYAKGSIRMKEDITNPYGFVHGGCLYTLADTVAGVAACSYGNAVTTIDGNLHFLRNAEDSSLFYCEATVCRQGRQIAVYEVKITDESGKLLDTGMISFYVYPVEI